MPLTAPQQEEGYSIFSPGDYTPVDGQPATVIDNKGTIASFFWARNIATSIEQGGGVGTSLVVADNVQIYDSIAKSKLLFDQTVICTIILVSGNPPIASDSGEGNPVESADGTTASIRTRICNGLPVAPLPDPITGNFKPASPAPNCPAIPPAPILSNLRGAAQIYTPHIRPLQIDVTIPSLPDLGTSYTLRVAPTWNGEYVDFQTNLQPGQKITLDLTKAPLNAFGLIGVDKVWLLVRAVNQYGFTDGMPMKDESGYKGYTCAPASWHADADSEQGNLVFDSTSSGSQLSGYWQIDMPYQCAIPPGGIFVVTHDDWPDEIINDQFTFELSYKLGSTPRYIRDPVGQYWLFYSDTALRCARSLRGRSRLLSTSDPVVVPFVPTRWIPIRDGANLRCGYMEGTQFSVVSSLTDGQTWEVPMAIVSGVNALAWVQSADASTIYIFGQTTQTFSQFGVLAGATVGVVLRSSGNNTWSVAAMNTISGVIPPTGSVADLSISGSVLRLAVQDGTNWRLFVSTDELKTFSETSDIPPPAV